MHPFLKYVHYTFKGSTLSYLYTKCLLKDFFVYFLAGARGSWVANYGDGWIRIGRWVAMMLAHFLPRAYLGVRNKTSLKNTL